MRDLSELISSRLLPRVGRPGQYIGLETNARLADVHHAEVTVALAFPDTYGIGISHLGSQVLYTMLNSQGTPEAGDSPQATGTVPKRNGDSPPWLACDRAYCPQADAEAVMRQEGIPLFGWESRAALRDFDILGFSLSYELCVTNVLTMLDLAGIELHADKRGPGEPIVIAGDALADSPEPLADFIDLFIVGEGEEPLMRLCELVRQMKKAGASRDEMILQAARTIPSIYAPRFYQPQYRQDGSFGGLKPVRDDVPAIIHRAHLASLSQSPALTAPLVPLAEAVHDRVAIEIMRGCPNSCRFCQAGHTRLPMRWRSIDEIIAIAQQAIAATGYHEISLLSLSTSDYPQLGELIDRLTAIFTPQKVSISLPSLRVDSQLRELPKLTSGVRKGGLTIAAEAGSERLRKAMHKNITEENMIEGVRAAYQAGWKSVKVYFMAGLPGEGPEDIEAIFQLCRRLSDVRKSVDNQRGSISASMSWAVPKPHTPMQWSAMRDAEYFWSVRNRLRELSHRTPISFKFHRIERSVLEAVLCRGDRRVGAAIEAAWRNGARMDSWDDHFDYDRWLRAFEQTGVNAAFHAHREIPLDEVTPWSHITDKRDEQFLRGQHQRMIEALAE